MLFYLYFSWTEGLKCCTRFCFLHCDSIALLYTPIITCLLMSMIETEVRLIPRNILFGNPDRTSPQISPDGTKLGWLAPVNGVLNVWVNPVGAEFSDARPVTNDTDRGIRGWFWGRDNRHVLYIQDREGDENWHLYSVDLETGKTKNYTPFENVQVHPIKSSHRSPDTILISMNKDNPELMDVYRLTLSSGELQKVAENPGNGIGWIADEMMQVRGIMGANQEGGWDLLLCRNGDDPWETFLTWDLDDTTSSGPVGFSLDGTELYATDSRDANAARLVKISLETGDVDVIVEDPIYDVHQVYLSRETNKPQLVEILRDRSQWVVLDETLRGDIDRIKTLGNGDSTIISRSDDENSWIVLHDDAESSEQYYLYDRSSKEATHLFSARPELDNYQLAQMEPFSFTARDGMTIHGYLTFPTGKDRTGLPMVLNVHGGPWTRDTWGYSAEPQWFANRGYICMGVNYRGSTGYGKDFVNAAGKEWGGKMHDDLVDAVNWALEQGYAGPHRVAIYGGSYGGYASLVGATFTPDLFTCAVALVGPSNLVTFINTIPPYWRPLLKQMHERVGNPETEEEFLKSRSPLFRVDNISIPMLIAHGANDPRVKQAESEQIVAAMKEKGIPHEYMLFPDEGHGFAKPENRMKFYGAAERFLAEHLGGRSEE